MCNRQLCEEPKHGKQHLCRQHWRAYQKERRDERREWVRKYKLEQGCARCGFNEHADALDFDHLDRATKHKSSGTSAIHISWGLERIKEHVMNYCQVLCANCHRIKTAEEAVYA